MATCWPNLNHYKQIVNQYWSSVLCATLQTNVWVERKLIGLLGSWIESDQEPLFARCTIFRAWWRIDAITVVWEFARMSSFITCTSNFTPAQFSQCLFVFSQLMIILKPLSQLWHSWPWLLFFWFWGCGWWGKEEGSGWKSEQILGDRLWWTSI